MSQRPARRQSPDVFRARQCEPAHNLRFGKRVLGAAASLAAAKADVYNSRPSNGGAVAQLGERLVRNEKVRSSILLGSTNSNLRALDFLPFARN